MMTGLGLQGSDIKIRQLGLQAYEPVLRAMQQFNQQRQPDTLDELWVVEHCPVFTLGLNAKPEHLLVVNEIPIIKTDRGGQVTYHGPGQVVVYALLDLNRRNLNVRALVSLLENAMIDTLARYGIMAASRADAPGVYVQGKKIGSLGLRIKNHCCYHGLSLNNNMDLSPFTQINPCGYSGLQVTQLVNLGVVVSHTELANTVTCSIISQLSQ